MKRFGKSESYKIKQYVFVFILLLIVIALYLFFTNLKTIAFIVMAIGLALVGALIVRQYDFLLTLKEYERAVVYRLGRVNRVGGPGWAIIIPIFESFRLIDLRTQTIDIPPQNIITKDSVVVGIDAVVYLHVTSDNQSVINSVVNVEDYKNSSRLFVIASIREAAGKLILSELISNLDKLNREVKLNLSQISKSWGVDVESVEITEIKIPKAIENAMTSYREAEQLKLARKESADAQKSEIEAVRDATEKLSDKALAYYYVRALEKLGEGQSTKFLFPIELTHLVSKISGSSSADSKLEELVKKYLPDIKKFVEANAEKKPEN